MEAATEIRYSEAFIEEALVKVYSRGNWTVQSVAEGLNVNYHTVKNWVKKKAVGKISVSTTTEKHPQDWNAEEQLVALEPMAYQAKLCRRGVVKTGYLPVT